MIKKTRKQKNKKTILSSLVIVDKLKLKNPLVKRQCQKLANSQIKVLLIGGFFIVVGAVFLLLGDWRLKSAYSAGSHGDYWAWTDTFGWFSLDCRAENCSLSATYGLNIPIIPLVEGSGPVTGEIWSDNLGWVCFGSTCQTWGAGDTPDYTALSATYNKAKTSSWLTGWAWVKALGQAGGWLKLRGDIVSTPAGPFPYCEDCYFGLGDEIGCRICYTDSFEFNEDMGTVGIGNICDGCSDCTGSGEPAICTACTTCYKYGTACRQNAAKADLDCLTGWAWNGNWSSPSSGAGQPGAGWLSFEWGGLLNDKSWLKTQWGDVYAPNFSGAANTPPAGQYNATYLIHAVNQEGGFVTFLSACFADEHYGDKCQQTGFDTLLLPKKETNYFNYLGRIDLAGIKKGYYGEFNDCTPSPKPSSPYNLITALQNCLFSNPLDGQIYYLEGDYTVDSPMTIINDKIKKGNGLIIIEGNLNFNANVQYYDTQLAKLKNLASIGWLVINDPETADTGKITINPDVRELAGVFYAENSIDTCKSAIGCDQNKLKVIGSMLTNVFKFNRTYVGTPTEGAEEVIDDGRALANTPPGLDDLVKGLPTWSATAP